MSDIRETLSNIDFDAYFDVDSDPELEMEVDGISSSANYGQHHVQPMFVLKHDCLSPHWTGWRIRADQPMNEAELDFWVRTGCVPHGRIRVDD